MRSKSKNKGLVAAKLQTFKASKMKLNVYLHVKYTVTKNKDSLAEIGLLGTPFTHPLLSDLSKKITFEELQDKIRSVLRTSEFESKFSICHFDTSRGIVGWMGKRSDQQCAKKVLKNVASVEISSEIEWQSHLSDFSTKINDEKRMKKMILLDLGIAIYSKEREVRLSQPRPSMQNKRKESTPTLNSDNGVAANKKKKKVAVRPGWRAPKWLQVDILHPVEFESKTEMFETTTIDPIGSVNIKFDRFVDRRFEKDVGDDDLLNVVSESGDSSDSSVAIDVDEKLKEDEDDEVKAHIYEPIRHILGFHILENKNGKYKIYANKLGEKVRTF